MAAVVGELQQHGAEPLGLGQDEGHLVVLVVVQADRGGRSDGVPGEWRQVSESGVTEPGLRADSPLFVAGGPEDSS
jgi:hypothetical protein